MYVLYINVRILSWYWLSYHIVLIIPLILQVALDLKNEATSQVKMMDESVSKVYMYIVHLCSGLFA